MAHGTTSKSLGVVVAALAAGAPTEGFGFVDCYDNDDYVKGYCDCNSKEISS